MSAKYILVGHRVKLEPDLTKWACWFETSNRRVARDTVNGISVSTVFLGLDHQFGDGPPMLFETMTFGPSDHEQLCERCSTWEEAEEQHRRVVQSLRERPDSLDAQQDSGVANS